LALRRRRFGGAPVAIFPGAPGGLRERDLWAEPLRQPLTDQACSEINRATRRERRDQPYRTRRIGLRPCDVRRKRQRGSARGQMQKISAGEVFFLPPFTSFDHPLRALVGKKRQFLSQRPLAAVR